LVQSENTILNDLSILQDTLDGYQTDLGNLQEDLAGWQAAPPSAERTAAILLLNSQIANKQSQINGVELQIVQKEDNLAEVQDAIALIEPTLETPYTSLTYNTVSLKWSATRGLIVPTLTVGDLTYVSTDGEVGQYITTTGNGNLVWSDLPAGVDLGNLQVDESEISSTVNGSVVSIVSSESAADINDGGVSLTFTPNLSSLTTQGSFVKALPNRAQINAGTNTLSLDNTGLSFDDDFVISRSNYTVIDYLQTGIIYTSQQSLTRVLKLVVQIEGFGLPYDAETNNIWHTQSCEVLVVRGGMSNIVHCSVYGVVYTSATAMATIDAQWNAATSTIEVTATNISDASIYTNVVVIEVASYD
jgi:hypothetical protein